MSSPILRQVDLANALTLTGLMLTVLSMVLAVQGHVHAALLALMAAGITDLFDGFVARRTRRTDLQAEVGKHLDSLVDVCSFGFGPAVLGYSYGLRHPVAVVVLMAFVGAAAMRLAYFNSVGMTSEGDDRTFTGLPVTYVALVLPLGFLATLVWPADLVKPALMGLYLALAVAMVSGVRIVKPRGIWYAIFPLIALVLAGIYGWALITGRAA